MAPLYAVPAILASKAYRFQVIIYFPLLLTVVFQMSNPPPLRLVLAMSALMLLSQRVTSVSMDLQDGKVIRHFRKSFQGQVVSLIPFISYTLYFPCLLGGPLCPFNTYVLFVEQISGHPPPSPLTILPRKMLQVLLLLVLKFLLTSFLQSSMENKWMY